MLNELFEKLPYEIAFKILTYAQPHNCVEIMTGYWRQLHNIKMQTIVEDIDRIYNEMKENNDTGFDFEDNEDFWGYYMYEESPQRDINQGRIESYNNGLENVYPW